MNGLDICVVKITKKLRDQVSLKDFIFDYVWKKNDHGILSALRAINQNHFYALEELMLVLNMYHQWLLRFKQRVASSKAEIKTNQYVDYALAKSMVGNALITEICSYDLIYKV